TLVLSGTNAGWSATAQSVAVSGQVHPCSREMVGFQIYLQTLVTEGTSGGRSARSHILVAMLGQSFTLRH
ncbi:MAG: hypothetical protein ACPGUV_07400, partial [Polyangiales bacterium]